MENRIAPIGPSEVANLKRETIPGEVFEVFNKLIAESFNSGYAIISQDDVVAMLVERGLSRRQIFDKGWLNVEEIYEEAGWKVEYDKPGYNESYAANFKFSSKR